MSKNIPAPKAEITAVSIQEARRFLKNVKKVGKCQEWQGATTWNGYGRIWLQGRAVRTHRLAYFLFYGSVDPKLEIDHICLNRKCVKPNHLEQVTKAENLRRRYSR